MNIHMAIQGTQSVTLTIVVQVIFPGKWGIVVQQYWDRMDT